MKLLQEPSNISALSILGTHARYASFLAYGDAEIYEDRLEEFRNELSKKE
jgi:hypothetical protein